MKKLWPFSAAGGQGIAGSDQSKSVDVCLIVEGTYPYVAGGVSSWTHDIINSQPELNFHLLAILPPNPPTKLRYEIPDNVTGITRVILGEIPSRSAASGFDLLFANPEQLMQDLRPGLTKFQKGGGAEALAEVMAIFAQYKGGINRKMMLNSRAAWSLMEGMYQDLLPEGPFLDFFWTWRFIMGNLFTILLAPLPRARLYHPVSTGYAGLFAARARLETGRPAVLTEHGIYTNERRIEITMADWLYEIPKSNLNVEEESAHDVKGLWIDTFQAQSLACYQTAEKVITLYGGNQKFQVADGAEEEKMSIIPNGIGWQVFDALERPTEKRRPTVALIGRVVPIKDIKTFIRASALVRDIIPDVLVWIMGPTEEDEEYYAECVDLVQHFGLEETIEFTGRVMLTEYLGRVDVMALTSISEGQPLVILEAGAAGIPSVTTDVGACREMIEGMADEEPPLGHAGSVVPVANPTATAEALVKLLNDPEWWQNCSDAIRQRVKTYYDKADLAIAYGDIYREMSALPDQPTFHTPSAEG